MLPAGLGTLICGVLVEQGSPDFKARMVFLRWTDPLPGSRAFTHIGPRDPRVDMKALSRKVKPLPVSAADQKLTMV